MENKLADAEKELNFMSSRPSWTITLFNQLSFCSETRGNPRSSGLGRTWWAGALSYGGAGGGGDQMTHQEAKLGEGQGVLMRGEYQGRAQLRSWAAPGNLQSLVRAEAQALCPGAQTLAPVLPDASVRSEQMYSYEGFFP